MGGVFSAKTVDEESNEGIKPDTDRKCRDVIFIPIFIAFWLGNFIVAAVAVANGEPERLIYGTDYEGTVCGTKSHKDEKHIFYPRLHEDLLYAQARGIPSADMDFYGVCVRSCPVRDTYTCNYATEALIQSDLDKVENSGTTRNELIAASSTYENDCWYLALDTENVFFRCLQVSVVSSETQSEQCLYPTDVDANSPLCEVKRSEVLTDSSTPTQADPLMEQLSTSYAELGRAGGDLITTIDLVLIAGAVLPLVFSLVWLLLLRVFAGVMVWVTVWAVLLSLMGVTLYSLTKGGVISGSDFSSMSGDLSTVGIETDDPQYQADKKNEDLYKVLGWVMAVLSLLMLMLIVALRKKIKIAVGIFREGSRAIGKMPLVMLFPIVTFILTLGLWAYFIVIGAYIYSMGDVSMTDFTETAGDFVGDDFVNGNYTSVEALDTAGVGQIMAAYHFFGFLWANQVIQAILMCTVGGAISAYYWAENKTKEEIGGSPVLTAFKRCFRYHFGSLVFGALIIAIVQFIRAILAYIDKKTKNLQRANMAIMVAMKCVQCCMWCFEKCLKFLSRNAYILIAMKGNSFCSAAYQSFWLIFKNLFQIGAVNLISNFLLLLARITITAGSAVLMFLFIDSNDDFSSGGKDELNFPITPVIAVAVMAWFVASMFMGVYDLAVDTILLCFCEDKKVNEASGKYFMSDELRKYIGAQARDKSAKGKGEQKEDGGTKAPVGAKSNQVNPAADTPP